MLRSRCAQFQRLNRRLICENRLAPSVTLRVKRGVPCCAGSVARVPWRGSVARFRGAVPWRGSVARFRERGSVSAFVMLACCAFRMLSSAISALFLSYFHLPRGPDLYFMLPNVFFLEKMQGRWPGSVQGCRAW